MTATVFLHRIDMKLIDKGYKYKLHDFDWLKRALGYSSFLIGPRENLLDVARTALAEANLVDK